MVGRAAEFATYHMSTDECPGRDHLAYWREVLGRQTLRIEMEALSDVPYRADLSLRTLPGLDILSGTAFSMRCIRTRALVVDGNSDFGLFWLRAGRTIHAQRSRELPLNAGNAILVSRAEPYLATAPEQIQYMGVGIPHASLASLVTNVDDAVMRVIPATQALTLLTGYVSSLMDNQGLATPELSPIAVSHVYDLAALAIGASRDAAAEAEGRGVRSARLNAVKADIATNLCHHDLSVGTVAARQGVGARYVQRLFETEGTTFSQFVLAQRLLRAQRMLSQPRYSDWKVSAIAFAAGFADLSYFNRTFRWLYGQTPSDMREGARRVHQ